jgi:hypothetical protein
MNTNSIKRAKWFWPWQDAREEAWLEKMSQEGLHLSSVHLPCIYHFRQGEPLQYSYRLDYINTSQAKLPEYLQIFQDAGWEYLGEMSNWRYWRKPVTPGEKAEIFTDTDSKIRKYRRMLGFMAFFLFFLVFMGSRIYATQSWAARNSLDWISTIYLVAQTLYAVIIPIYVVVVIQLLRRINELKKKSL